ncbi:GNAT family N-acetyltransferase [Sinomicrobium kalidii]|uniref:GNAT family N-acetyltransferase n=1 Tax=Sinomicrobium kalidii TaxID=2900738 RepID=UPI001E4C25DE|nr:GNAT family N-acetyltransferase [Sinomicrobium kalidii]UGU18075.1 GNAT family N-acetyltransferase [Sinomicrobium kalidii]
MNIRFAREEDLRQISGLCKEHARYEKTAWLTKNHEKRLGELLFKEDSPLKCLVVEYKGEIVGYATYIKQISTWDANFYIYLDCLYLKERIRGKGAGKQVMEQIKEDATSENCNMIQWQTPNFNIKAIRFYYKLGATSKNKERFFWHI